MPGEIASWRGFHGQSQLGLNQKRKLKWNFLALTGSPFGQAQNMIPDPPHQGSRQIHFSGQLYRDLACH
jgi:hypothetical protein